MFLPENIQQVFIGDLLRVIVDLDGFGMIPQTVICRVFLCAARIADTGADNAFFTPEPGVRAPESAHCEGGGFRLRRGSRIDGGNGDFRVDLFISLVHGITPLCHVFLGIVARGQ